MPYITKKILGGVLLLVACQFVAGCGGSSTNTAIVTTSTPTIFYAHSVIFRNSTTVGWGFNGNGQLGNGNAAEATTPVVTTVESGSPLVGMTDVAVGGTHSLAFKNLSGVRAWGNNGLGQLGNGSGSASSRAVLVKTNESGNPLLNTVTAVAAGGNHSLALRSGSVWAWGHNGYGQLGDNSTTSRNVAVPAQIPSSPIIVSIAAGGSHSLACDDAGRVWGWGYNEYGQLGGVDTVNQSVPREVVFPAGVVAAGAKIIAVAAGGSTSLALDDKGNVYGWGYNGFGQLGVIPPSDKDFKSVPQKINGLANIDKISVGHGHCLALDNSGKIWSWGYNGYGQLGRGKVENVPDATPNHAPELVTGISGTVIDIRAIGHHSLAVTGNAVTRDIKKGKVWSWGYSTYGQLGNGTSATTPPGKSDPAIVKGYENVP